MATYIKIEESEVPKAVRFDVAGPNQGQIVEVAYGTFGRSEAGPGDPYKRIADQAIAGTSRRTGNGVTFYARVR